jgi:hypothetical protein
VPGGLVAGGLFAGGSLDDPGPETAPPQPAIAAARERKRCFTVRSPSNSRARQNAQEKGGSVGRGALWRRQPWRADHAESRACRLEPESRGITARGTQGGSDLPASTATHQAIGVARWHASDVAFSGYDDKNVAVVSFVAAVKNVAADTMNVTLAVREREGTSSYAFTVVDDPQHGTANTTITQRDEPEPGAPMRTLKLFLADSGATEGTLSAPSSLSPSSLRPTVTLVESLPELTCVHTVYNFDGTKTWNTYHYQCIFGPVRSREDRGPLRRAELPRHRKRCRSGLTRLALCATHFGATDP